MGGQRAHFWVIITKANNKGVFNSLLCCYGNLLRKDDHNLCTGDWVFECRVALL